MQAFAPAFLAKRSRRPRHRDQPLADYAKALVTLHLEGAGLQALLSFRHAPALRVLYAQGNELEEAGEALATCPHLTDLFLGGNRIASMGAGLRWCMYLKVLHIGGNCLEVVEGLENLFCLEELHAEDQNLALRRQGGEGAAQPPVRLLYAQPPSQQQPQQQQQQQQQQLPPPPPLEFCEASFQNVGHRGKLLSLDLSGNGLRAIEPALLYLRALQKLNLSNNALAGPDALGALLAACGALRELDTRGNPMHGLRDCRSRLVVLAPQTLVELDGLAVLEAQRVGLMRLEGHRRRLRRAGGGAGGAARHRMAAAGAGGGSPERVQSPGGNVISLRSGGGAQLFGGSSPHTSSQSAQDLLAPGASLPPRALPLLSASAAAAAAHRVVVRNEHTWAGKTLGSRTSSKGMIARPPRRQRGHLHKAKVGGGDALDQHMAAPQGGAAAQRAAAGQPGAVLSARPSVHGAMTPTVFAQAGQALSRNSSHVFFRH
jgi:hypothetical protein